MDRGGPTRRAAGRVAGGADPKRVGPCPRGVRAHRGRVARGGRVARRGVRARAGATARNPNDPRIFARCPRVLRKKNHRSIGNRTHLRSRCPPAEPSKRRASRCPASRTEPVPRKGGSGEIKTSDGQLEVLRRPRTRVGNETIGNTVSRREPRCNTERVFRSVSRSASPPRPRKILYGLLRRTLSPFGNPGLEAWIRSCVLLLGVSSEDAIASRGVAPGKEDIITPLPTCQPRRAPDTACASTRDRVLNGELLPSKPLRTCASTRPTRARHEWRGGARVGR
jgi:hypothetical protein